MTREIKPACEWAAELAAQAGPGWIVEVERQPPYGWNLRDPGGTKRASGSLDRIEAWLTKNPQLNPQMNNKLEGDNQCAS